MNKPTTNTANPAQAPREPWPVFRLAFRPLFWLGALYSVFCLTLWLANFSFGIPFSTVGGAYFWHMHEMLFGFAAAIVVGFLLTAVQNWTQIPGLKGWPLALLVTLWLLGRLAMLAPDTLSTGVIQVLDLAFLPLAAACLARPIIKARKWRNLMFVPILLLMTALNGWMHYSLGHPSPTSFLHLAHAMILLVALVMTLIGGRVFPMFTANATQTARVTSVPWLEFCAVTSVLLCVPASLQLMALPAGLEPGLYLLAGLSNLARAWRWRIGLTWGTPLLWSLHISYWAMALGLILVGFAQAGWLITVSAAYHAIAVGGMGVMILAMISRVSLGHTGRPITAGAWITLALLLITAAFVVRTLAPLMPGATALMITLAGGLWLLAYGIFVVIYTPVLFSPRADGKPG